MTAPDSPDVDDDLPALRAPPVGRRTDDAFARAVRADVDAARKRWSPLWLSLPALAGAAAVVVAVSSGGGSDVDARAIYVAALEGSGDVEVFDDDVDGVIAMADVADDDEFAGDFAIPGIGGSSDRELEDIEAALDHALKL